MKKGFINGYGPGIKIFSGVAILTTVIVGGFFGYRYYRTKFTPVTSVKPTEVQKTVNSTKPKANFDGNYSGNSNVANGISSANVSVSGGALTGKASYNGYGSIIPVNVAGTVQRGDTSTRKDGNIQGTFSGAGIIFGQKVTVTGSFSGHIITSSMNISYSATASGVGQTQTYPGQMTLSKR